MAANLPAAAQVEKNRIRHIARRAIFSAAMLFAAAAVFAQNSVSLEAEIQNIERTAARQGVPAAERHDALVRLARLRQLSGDIEGAARNWLEAAAAIPGSVDDDALLACAYCLAALGEWDRAAAALEPLMSKSPRARFLNISINAIKTGDVSALAAIANSGEYSQMKSEIYFMLWKTSLDIYANGSHAETWRQRLIAEFPQTPEGRIAFGESSSAVIVRPSPFWLFAGGLDSLSLISESAAPSTAAAPQPAAAPQSPAATSQAAVRLQTGLFSRQANAQVQMTNLRQAGFNPSMEQRGEMWAVVVTSGNDQVRAIRELREAGFDSFPIR
jgi:tetratricopeptide (TPR) repeat protein